MGTRSFQWFLIGATILTLSLANFSASAEKFRLPLQATEVDPEASGHLDFEVREDRVKLSIEVEHLSAATSVTFIVGDDDLGTLPVVAGIADLNLDSRVGDTVPAVTVETVVQVIDANTLDVILFRNGDTDGGEEIEPNELRLCLAATDADPLASGKAVFRVREDGLKLKIEVEDVASATSVIFSVEGVDVGTSAVAFGIAVLRLDSRLGDAVPEVGEATLIEVRDAATDDLLLSSLGAGSLCEFPEDDPDDGLEIEFKLRARLSDDMDQIKGNARFRVVSRSGDDYYGGVMITDLFKFRVAVEDLPPDTTFPIAINDVVIGSITTNELGNGEVQFSSHVEDELTELPLPENFPAEVNVGDVVTIGELLSGVFEEEFEHGDLDHDGDIDSDDVDILESLIGFSGSSAADLNGDGAVNSQDLSVIRGIAMPLGTLLSLLLCSFLLVAAHLRMSRRRE